MNVKLISIFIAIFVFVLRIIVRYIHNKDKPLAERLIGEDVIDGLLITSIFGIIISIAFSALPDIKSILGEVSSVVEDSPEYKVLQSLTKSRRSVEVITDIEIKNIFTDFLRKETDEYRASISSIANSQIVIRRENAMYFGESAFKAAKVSVNTTSYVSPHSWWLTSEGKAYFFKNEDAIKRGVKVKRIFIYMDNAEHKRLEPVIIQQKKAGVIVYSALVSSLPKGWTRDIIIVDGKLVGELALDMDTRDFNKVDVHAGVEDVKRVNENWEDLLRLSKQE